MCLALGACTKFGSAEPESDAGDAGAKGVPVTMEGLVVEFSNPATAIPGVEVSTGKNDTTTDAKGRFVVEVEANEPFVPRFTSRDHMTMRWDEVVLSGNVTLANPIPQDHLAFTPILWTDFTAPLADLKT